MKELGERDPTTLVAMSNTGVALANVGRADEALVLHERAAALRAEILGPLHPSTLTSRRAVADDMLDLQRVGEARAALQQLAETGKSAWGPTHRHTLSARVSLARSLELLADFPAALAELNELEALHVQVHGEDHFDTLGVAIQRARVLRLSGHAQQGRDVLERLLPLAMARYGARLPLYAEGVAELAACQLETGAVDRAVAALTGLLGDAETAVTATPIDSAGARPGDAAARQARRAGWQRLLTRALAQQGRVEAAFALLEAQKSQRLLASLGQRAAADSAGLSRADIGRLQDHQERVLLLTDGVRSARLPQDRQRVIQDLDQAIAAQQAWQAGLRQRYPLYEKLTQLPVAAGAHASRLPAGALLVSFVVEGDARLGAFTLSGQGLPQWHPLGHSPGLAQSVESLRLWATQWGQRRLADDQGRVVEIVRWDTDGQPHWRVVLLDAPPCNNPAENPHCRPTSASPVHTRADHDALRQHLSNRLLAPLAARLQRHAHWVVSPDTGLGALPLDVLPWRGGLVAERVRVSHVASLSALHAVGQRHRTRNGPGLALMAIGSPDFGAQPGRAPAAAAEVAAVGVTAEAAAGVTTPPPAGPAPWAPLPAAAEEMRSAAAQFAGQRTLVATGPAATEANLRRLSINGDLARARYVLMATHAWYQPSRPGRSHLVFGAVGSLPSEDGQMTATELAGLDMRSELTVVSACNSARGESSSSEGQFGFAYGLAIAGNQNALLTLWPVGDQSSAAFVSRFFYHLARQPTRSGGHGQGHVQALYATKRDFMKHPRPAWRHPKVWGAFALFGA